MVTLLRLLLYLQVLLGLGRFAGLIRNERIWEAHLTLGILIAALALFALRRPAAASASQPAGGQASLLPTIARFAPVLPLATGLVIYLGAVQAPGFTLLHMALGIATVGLVEAAAARR